MKLIVQIPCLNEEETLPLTVRDIPRTIEGIEAVEILVIDDGSTDRTSEVAREVGVDHIVRFEKNQGLAKAFMTGVDSCLMLGADIIVNTDGDNQYCGQDIPKLIQPILEGKADMVIGDRQTHTIEHFSFTKKKLQKFGSWVVRQLSGAKVPDAASSFRAMTRNAALRLNIISDFSYTLEAIIQAAKKKFAIKVVPVRTNEKLREPRLYSSTFVFLKKSASTIIRTYATYEPLRIFFGMGGLMLAAGIALGVRFLYFYLTGNGEGHIQSVVFAAILTIIGFLLGLIGLLADLISTNRRLIEDLSYRMRKLELSSDKKEPLA
ncbi:MAG: glycosyltransferase family 2 protein [Gemmatimonadota bacterium]|nr:MAG: glycosyltransferase family 2 protein [Gemmatimonadota bacterium]